MARDESGSPIELAALRTGQTSATRRFAHRYWGRLQGLVRLRIRWYGRPAISVDEEDVANAALNSALIRLQRGDYPEIQNESGLWRLLARIATRKAGRVVEKWQRRPAVRPLSSLVEKGVSVQSPVSRIASAEEQERLLDSLRAYQPQRSKHPQGEELVQLVRLLADDRDVPQIAELLGVARCTVYRWLALVRRIAAEQGILLQIDEHEP
jgi:hypothetical protein